MLKPPSHFFIAGIGNNTARHFAVSSIDQGRCLGIVDDKYAGNDFNGVVVRDIEFLSAQKTPQLVVISIFNPTAAHIVASKIFALGHRPIFLEEFVVLTGAERTLINFPELEDVDKFLEVDHFFDDQLSKLTVNAIKCFWKTGNRASLYGVAQAQKSIYFNEAFLPKSAKHCFVDVGAYDGDSFAAFQSHYQTFNSAHLFEPVYDIEITNQPENVYIHKVGLGSKSQRLTFQADGLNSRENVGGDVSVTIQPLDDFNLIPTFIKIDAEGGDIDVLHGAEKTLRAYKPIVAVSVYHLPSHLREAISIFKLELGYDKFYLRKYSPCNDETVLYAVG